MDSERFAHPVDRNQNYQIFLAKLKGLIKDLLHFVSHDHFIFLKFSENYPHPEKRPCDALGSKYKVVGVVV